MSLHVGYSCVRFLKYANSWKKMYGLTKPSLVSWIIGWYHRSCSRRHTYGSRKNSSAISVSFSSGSIGRTEVCASFLEISSSWHIILISTQIPKCRPCRLHCCQRRRCSSSLERCFTHCPQTGHESSRELYSVHRI